MRWCARCRDPELRRANGLRTPSALPEWLVDALAGRETAVHRLHAFDGATQSAPTHPAFRGVRVYPNALDEAEAAALQDRIEALPFEPSQSGKLKQHFGPRFNFMRRRMNAERFDGLPEYAAPLEERVRARVAADETGDRDDLEACRRALDAYCTTDVFVLRYLEHEESNLDFHLDDLYAYGEAILDLSLESDSVLSFLGPFGPERTEDEQSCVRVPLPARSLAVIYGAARFDWQHAILPGDVCGIRTSLTFRTLAPALRATAAGREVLARAGARERV